MTPPRRVLVVLALAVPLTAPLSSRLAAQQPPLAPEHALLKEMAGTWKVTTPRMTASGRARTVSGYETSELVCGGLWLETVERGGSGEMLSLTGFDPGPRRFVRLSVANRLEPVIEDGEFDAGRRTITWRSRAGEPAFRDVTTLPAGQPRVDRRFTARAKEDDKPDRERVYAPASEGERAAPKPDQPKAPAPEYELLAQFAGDWQCALTATLPGMAEPMRSTGRMREAIVGDACWVRSTFEGEFGGSRIEGHGLFGFDPKQKRYVRFWVDNGSPVLAISSCVPDATGRKLIGTGATQMPEGEVTTEDEVELGAEQRRVVQRLRTKDGKDAGTFEMLMTRQPPAKK